MGLHERLEEVVFRMVEGGKQDVCWGGGRECEEVRKDIPV